MPCRACVGMPRRMPVPDGSMPGQRMWAQELQYGRRAAFGQGLTLPESLARFPPRIGRADAEVLECRGVHFGAVPAAAAAAAPFVEAGAERGGNRSNETAWQSRHPPARDRAP